MVSNSPGGITRADLLFNRGEDHFSFFDARAGRRAGVQPDLSGIDGGKEIASHQIDQAQRTDRENQETGQHRSRR